MKCCCKAHQLSFINKEFSCVREYCGSEKDTMTATAFCQSRLFSPTHASDRDPHTHHLRSIVHFMENAVCGVFVVFSLFFLLILTEHSKQIT